MKKTPAKVRRPAPKKAAAIPPASIFTLETLADAIASRLYIGPPPPVAIPAKEAAKLNAVNTQPVPAPEPLTVELILGTVEQEAHMLHDQISQVLNRFSAVLTPEPPEACGLVGGAPSSPISRTPAPITDRLMQHGSILRHALERLQQLEARCQFAS